jgi:hypothetical protein
MAALINSRPTPSADALNFRIRFGRGFLFTGRCLPRVRNCFAGMTLFLSIEIDQRNDRAIDFIIDSISSLADFNSSVARTCLNAYG